jgi:hypothetical protein
MYKTKGRCDASSLVAIGQSVREVEEAGETNLRQQPLKAGSEKLNLKTLMFSAM